MTTSSLQKENGNKEPPKAGWLLSFLVTRIEMLIVLIIVALLMAIIIPNVAGQKERIEKQARQNMAQIIETQVNTYKLAENDSEVTVKELKTAGYLTDKQVEEAKKLLQLDENTTITLPINIPQP